MKNLNRRQFMNLAAGAAASTISLAACSAALARTAKAVKRPNTIFLLTDDHRGDALGCAGNTIIQTPNIDDLAANGVRFTNAFVTTSICACSRASIFTGQWTARHRLIDL